MSCRTLTQNQQSWLLPWRVSLNYIISCCCIYHTQKWYRSANVAKTWRRQITSQDKTNNVYFSWNPAWQKRQYVIHASTEPFDHSSEWLIVTALLVRADRIWSVRNVMSIMFTGRFICWQSDLFCTRTTSERAIDFSLELPWFVSNSKYWFTASFGGKCWKAVLGVWVCFCVWMLCAVAMALHAVLNWVGDVARQLELLVRIVDRCMTNRFNPLLAKWVRTAGSDSCREFLKMKCSEQEMYIWRRLPRLENAQTS